MIECVHADRINSLAEQHTLALLKRPTIEVSASVIKWIHNRFPDGLSFFGWRYAEGIYKIEHGDFSPHKNFEDCLIERDFEAVRQQHYPQMPSRLQCMFAAASSIDLMKYWSNLFSAQPAIYEIFCSAAYSMDATFLKSYSAETKFVLTENTPGYENICKYWQGGQSPTPKIELLVPIQGGVHIGRQLVAHG